MVILTPAMHPELTQYVITLLNKHQIQSDVDFMKGDNHKLANATNMDYRMISDIKRHLIEVERIRTQVSSYQYFIHLSKTPHMLPTNIKSLDDLLSGGFTMRMIVEIVGLPASGKTQLCNTIAINLSKICSIGTLYIDCKNDFSGMRLFKMLEAQKCLENEMKTVMSRIKIQNVINFTELISVLRELLDKLETFTNQKLLIIDSMPALLFQIQGDKCNAGMKSFATVTKLLKELAMKRGIVILVVNLMTRGIQKNRVVSNADDTSTSQQASPSEKNVEVLTPALGRYWQSEPLIRLLISKPINAGSPINRTIRILKSATLKTDEECKVTITNSGII